MQFFKTAVPALVMILLLAACQTTTIQPPPSPQATTTQVESQTPAMVVALTSLAADIIYRLDSRKLVGIPGSRLLRQNPDLAKIPQVSEGLTPPNLEKIVALKPDLVIGATGFHDQVLAKLKNTGIRTLTTQMDSWRSLENLTRTLASEIKADPAPLLQSYQSFLTVKSPRPESTLVLVSYQPILAPNKTSWAGDLLAKFQINNIAANLQGESLQKGYVTLSPEKVLAANPQILILVDVGDGTVAQLKAAPFWNKLDAVVNNRVYVFDYYGLVNPGSIDAIAKACQQLQQILSTPN